MTKPPHDWNLIKRYARDLMYVNSFYENYIDVVKIPFKTCPNCDKVIKEVFSIQNKVCCKLCGAILVEYL